jgi:glyoxylate/hydroxypyruvate reductase A
MSPAALFTSDYYRAEDWLPALARWMPELEVRVWPDIGEVRDIDIALVHNPPPGFFASLPALRAIIAITAGIENLVTNPELPDVPIARAVDDLFSLDMAQYVVLHALRHVRHMPEIVADQRARRWRPMLPRREATAGVMGLGAMGGTAARALAAVGFGVAGWSRSAKHITGIECHHGAQGLAPFLAATDILVCLLPLTPATRDLINAETLSRLRPGACLINAGRGHQVVDADLLAALDSGQLAHATLDVFREEPLPADSPYWDHPSVTITCHSASDPNSDSVALTIAENIRRARAGEPLLYPVDRSLGY